MTSLVSAFVVVLFLHVHLQGFWLDVLNIINYIPKHAFKTWRRSKASSIYPSLLPIDSRHQLLKVDALVIQSFIITLYNLRQKLMVLLHVILLDLVEHVFIAWNIEENCSNRISPVFEKVFLVFLHVHELVDYMKLHFEFFIINGMLTWAVEMKLDATSDELMIGGFFIHRRKTNRWLLFILLRLIIKQINRACRQEIFSVI